MGKNINPLKSFKILKCFLFISFNYWNNTEAHQFKKNCGVEFFIESYPLLYAVAVVVVVDVVIVVVVVVVVVAPFVFTDHLNRFHLNFSIRNSYFRVKINGLQLPVLVWIWNFFLQHMDKVSQLRVRLYRTW